MTQYAILLPGNEDDWSGASPAEREATYERHREFMQVLGGRGHTITGGAELSHSRDGKTVRGTLDDVIVTEGPFAETVEQLTGFYLVESDDLDDLLRVTGLLTVSGGVVEVRACVAPSDPVAPKEGGT